VTELALGAMGAVVRLNRLRLGPQTALQTMMFVALLTLLWAAIKALARRSVAWATRVYGVLHPYTRLLYDRARSAPMTMLYVATWSVTSVIQQGTPANIQDVVDRYNSTNLTLLAHNPVRVLFSSAFIIDDHAWGFIGYVLVYVTVVAAVERALGWRRTLIIWVSSHVLGSLATAVTEALLVHFDVLSNTVSFASDVGVSYVMVGSCGAYLLMASRRSRWLVGSGLLAGVGLPLALSHTVWDVGHAYATLIGLGIGALVLRGAQVRPEPPWRAALAAARAAPQ
jgi:hypothetical protein